MLERSFAEKDFAFLDVSVGKGNSCRSDLDIAFLAQGKSEKDAAFENGKKIFYVHHQFFGETKQVRAATAIAKQFKQAGDAADVRVRKHLISSGPDWRFLLLEGLFGDAAFGEDDFYDYPDAEAR